MLLYDRNIGLSSVIFGNLWKMPEECSETFIFPLEQIWKIFGKWSEIFGKSSKTSSLICLLPRRVLAKTAKTRGGTLGAPAYREKNFAVPEKVSIFENTARKGLPKVRWGSNKQAKDSGSVLYTTRF